MKQKMWVRKDTGPDDWGWEVGCQRCGRIIGTVWHWDWAIRSVEQHALQHRLAGYHE